MNSNEKQKLPTDSYMSYLEFVRKEIQRPLTCDEYATIMSFYINSKPVAKCVDKLEEKKK